MIRFLERNPVLTLVLVCVFIFFPHLDVLYENIMEARNFNSAREMLTYDNWILTTMNGEPRYEKPPLPTWITAIFGWIFNISTVWALRLPAALAAVILVLILFKLAKRLGLTQQQALTSGLILASSFYIIFAGRNGTWDIYAHSFMLVGIYFVFKLFRQEQHTILHGCLAGLFMGLSALSKGPVSHVALLLPFLAAYAYVFRLRGIFKKWVSIILWILITGVLALSWYAAIYFLDTESALAIIDKEVEARANRNIRPFYYYWSFFTQSGIWTIPAFVGLLYPYLKSRVKNPKLYLFSLLWTLGSVFILSCIPEKKSRYLLPVLIPLALNTSFYIEYLIYHFKQIKDKRELFPIYLHYGVLIVIGIVVPVAGIFILGEGLLSSAVWYVLLSLALIALSIRMFYFLKNKEFKPLFYLTIVFVCSIITFGFPLIKLSYTNGDYQQLSEVIDQYEEKNLPVYLYNNASPELIWDMGKRIPVLSCKGKLSIPQEQKFIVLVDSDFINTFEEQFSEYDVNKLDEVDGNITSKKDRNYKKRRVAHVYRVTH